MQRVEYRKAPSSAGSFHALYLTNRRSASSAHSVVQRTQETRVVPLEWKSREKVAKLFIDKRGTMDPSTLPISWDPRIQY